MFPFGPRTALRLMAALPMLLVMGLMGPLAADTPVVAEPVITTEPGRAEASVERLTASGYVYLDANGDQKRSPDEAGLGGVFVSNGREIVRTSPEGRYQLPVSSDTTIFVIKPRDFRTAISDLRLPRFFYTHKPEGSPPLEYAGVPPTGPLPESIDFPLYPHPETDNFTAIFFGDTQPRDRREIDYFARDILPDVVGTKAALGITLGDIVFDQLQLFEPQAQAIATLGIPWYNVLGNHDMNFDARDDTHSDETFERIFGPNYYAFNYGPIHFVVLDDVQWIIDEATGAGRYIGAIGERQLEFIRRDLELVAPDQLVVYLMHIPLNQVEDREAFFRLIERHPYTVSFSAHTHTHEHHFFGEAEGWRGERPHHHITHVTVCGSWWQGAPDERGIPHTMMADGGPNGYSLVTFAGNQFRLEYRAASRSPDYQMEIRAPRRILASSLADRHFTVNVFNGSSRSLVEYRILPFQDWQPCEKLMSEDPSYRQVYEAEARILDVLQPDGARPDVPWRRLTAPKVSTHLWRANFPSQLTPGVHRLEVRTIDLHGQHFASNRLIRVVDQ